MPDVLLLRPKSIPLLQKARNDRVVLLGALFGNLSILLLDKLDCVLVHEGLYISQQRVVLTLNKRYSLLEHSIKICVIPRAYLTWGEDHHIWPDFILRNHSHQFAVATKPAASKLRW